MHAYWIQLHLFLLTSVSNNEYRRLANNHDRFNFTIFTIYRFPVKLNQSKILKYFFFKRVNVFTVINWFSCSVKLKPSRMVHFETSCNLNTVELKRLTVCLSVLHLSAISIWGLKQIMSKKLCILRDRQKYYLINSKKDSPEKS